MNSLQIINSIHKKIYSFGIILIILSSNVFGLENKIIFKINENAYTLLDYEKRIKYLDFVGNNDSLTDDVILNDFISTNLFFEYHLINSKNEDYRERAQEIFNNILEINKKDNKTYENEIDKVNILLNLEKDLIRKTILENIINTNINNIEFSKEEIDLLYNFKIKYINFDKENYSRLKSITNNTNNIKFEKLISILNNNNIKYFLKKKEIEDLNKIDIKIKKEILSNKDFFILKNNNNISFIFIEKRFETYNGIIVNLYSIQSKNNISENNLKCSNLVNSKDEINIINKEYKLVSLNKKLKENLININDYVKLNTEDDNNVYIILCDINFDKEILDNISLNKLINSNAADIEKNFIKKYSKIYNLIILND